MNTVSVTEKQREFLESKDPLTVFRGGIRSGKTFIGCLKAIVNALAGRKQLVISVDYTQSRDVIVPTFRQVLPTMGLVEGEDYVVNKSDMDLILHGTYIHMRSAERADRLRGISAADAMIDEARDIRGGRDLYNVVIGRLSDAADSQVYITSSPSGKDWVWSLSEERHAKVIKQTTYENPFLSDEYIQRLEEQYAGAFADQEIRGDIIELVGEIIDPSWFITTQYIQPSEGVRFWDLAFSDKKTSDWSVGTLCHRTKDGIFVIDDIVRLRAQYPDLKETIIKTAISDGRGIRIGLEDVAAQRAVIDDVARDSRLKFHVIVAQRPVGTKMARAMPWVSRAKLGQVRMAAAPWNDAFRAECAGFRADDTHEHDDIIDSVSGAFGVMATHSSARTANVRL